VHLLRHDGEATTVAKDDFDQGVFVFASWWWERGPYGVAVAGGAVSGVGGSARASRCPSVVLQQKYSTSTTPPLAS
jgi:hypothetical protein